MDDVWLNGVRLTEVEIKEWGPFPRDFPGADAEIKIESNFMKNLTAAILKAEMNKVNFKITGVLPTERKIQFTSKVDYRKALEKYGVVYNDAQDRYAVVVSSLYVFEDVLDIIEELEKLI